MTSLDILKNYLAEVWENQNLSVIDMYFDKQSSTTGIMSDLETQIQDFHALVPAFLQHIRQLKIEILQAIEQENQAWVLIAVRSCRALDMQPIEIKGQIRIETQNGKIIKMDNHVDLLGFFEQLGFLPQNTLKRCCAGETLS